MTLLPKTSRAPLPPPLAMSTAQPSPIPQPAAQQQQQQQQQQQTQNQPANSYSSSSYDAHNMTNTLAPRPHVPKPSWPKPRLNLKIVDASHPGARLFFRAFIASDIFEEAVDAVLTTLYGEDPSRHAASARPAVRSITLVLRSMDGVAYTARREELADDNHKEIHMNLEHFKNVMEGAKREKKQEQDARRKEQQQAGNNDSSMELDHQTSSSDREKEEEEERERFAAGRAAAEFHGVLVHEMVHCWQWNGCGTAPGGLIEGVADYVRLKEDLAPPHWDRQRRGERWDQGYETTAFFLVWCEQLQRGDGKGKAGGTVRQLNQWLQDGRYDGDKLWLQIFGRPVKELWEEYSK